MNKRQERLLENTVAENNKAIAGAISEVIGADINDYSSLSGLKLNLNTDQLAHLKNIRNFALEPARKEDIEKWLNALWLVTAKNKEMLNQKQAIINNYVDCLLEYPTDVAKATTKTTFEWFPSKAELLKAAEANYSRRKLYFSRLDRITGGLR